MATECMSTSYTTKKRMLAAMVLSFRKELITRFTVFSPCDLSIYGLNNNLLWIREQDIGFACTSLIFAF